MRTNYSESTPSNLIPIYRKPNMRQILAERLAEQVVRMELDLDDNVISLPLREEPEDIIA